MHFKIAAIWYNIAKPRHKKYHIYICTYVLIFWEDEKNRIVHFLALITTLDLAEQF